MNVLVSSGETNIGFISTDTKVYRKFKIEMILKCS